ncbi:MAG TPA: hypothetical protein DER26_05260 [Verrucomicrobia bacterium]|nr:hypothetical protein [Verrucomicrobiota bacterium]
MERGASSRRLFAKAIAILALSAAPRVCAIDASNRYASPRNAERAIRSSTELIVLHTTEAAARGSLNKLSERGECHFCVTEDGSVYRIVDRDREAFHAGRSMWKGKDDVDKFSIGIECVGYHDKSMPLVQLKAIAKLVSELQSMYGLGDDKVVCHSHVAYGAPNKWQKRKHRGRKRCGMLFAMPSVRRVLGLSSRPAYDPDTRAGRLVVGDAYLAKVLYGNVDTWRSVYPASAAKKTVPGSAKTRAARKATPTGAKKKTASALRLPPRSIAELKARGYKVRGRVSKGVTASQLVGKKWNDPDTYYTIRDKVIPGNIINPARIEVGMCVWTR